MAQPLSLCASEADLVWAGSHVIGELLHDLLQPGPHPLAGRGRVEPSQTQSQTLHWSLKQTRDNVYSATLFNYGDTHTHTHTHTHTRIHLPHTKYASIAHAALCTE